MNEELLAAKSVRSPSSKQQEYLWGPKHKDHKPLGNERELLVSPLYFKKIRVRVGSIFLQTVAIEITSR
jgi:hypothetical protein